MNDPEEPQNLIVTSEPQSALVGAKRRRENISFARIRIRDKPSEVTLL